MSHSFCYLTPYRNVIVNKEDDTRDKIDPDKLRNGLDHYASSSNDAELYNFLARYLRKVYPDTDIKKDLKNNEVFSFIDEITPSDIAFVIIILKNGHNIWDQTMKIKQLGVAVHGERETRLQQLFTGGKGKKKEQGMSLWSVEGLKYFRHAEIIWKEVYADNEKKQMMYGEFENWLNMYSKNITVGKSNKTLHLVLARWTLKDDEKLRKTVESKCNGTEEEEEEGYNSDRGYNLLSKMWSREEREKQNRKEGSDVEKADEARRGNKDDVEDEIEESADEINSSTFELTKRKYARGQQMWAFRQRQ